MKRGTIEHPKMIDLALFLDVKRCTAVGLMECLWHLAAQFAKDGNLQKYKPRVLAEKIYWDGDPDLLMKGLVESHWLDVLNEEVTYIHDWHEHCEDYVNKFLLDNNLVYANGAAPRWKSGKVGISRNKSEKVGISRNKSEKVGKRSHQPMPLPLYIPPIPPQSESTKSEAKSEAKNEKYRSEYSEGFLRFWGVYPRKKNKANAGRAWKKNNCEKIVDVIVLSVEEHKRSKDWRKDDGQYIPHPATFLNGHGWEDEVENKKNGGDPRGRRFSGKGAN